MDAENTRLRQENDALKAIAAQYQSLQAEHAAALAKLAVYESDEKKEATSGSKRKLSSAGKVCTVHLGIFPLSHFFRTSSRRKIKQSGSSKEGIVKVDYP